MLDLDVEKNVREAMSFVVGLGTQMLKDLGSVAPMVFALKGQTCNAHMLNFNGPEMKKVSTLATREKLKGDGPDMAVFMAEAWLVKVQVEKEEELKGTDLSEHPDKIEVMMLVGAADECQVAAAWEISRKESGEVFIGKEAGTSGDGVVTARIFDGVFKPAVKLGRC